MRESFLKKAAASLLLFIVVSIVIHIEFAAVIASLLLTHIILKQYLSTRIFNTTVFRFVVSGVFYVSFLQCIVLISWLLSRNFPLDKTPLLGLVILIATAVIHYIVRSKDVDKKQRSVKKTPFIAVSDILSVALVTAFIFFAIAVPTFQTNGLHKSAFVGLISDGVDDSAHLGILNDRVAFNKGVIVDTTTVAAARFNAISFYPAGWHAANVALVKAIDPKITAGSQTLLVYAVLKVFWYFILLLVFTRSIFAVYMLFAQKKPSVEIYVLVALLSMVFYYIFLLHPFREGFFSYFPQLIAAPLFVLGLIEMALAKKDDKNFQKPLPFIAIIAAGGVLSWLLILPIFVIAIVLSIVDRIRQTNTKSFFSDLLKTLPSHAVMYLVVIAAIITQLYVASISKEGVSFIAGILQGGGIAVYDNLFYAVILIGVSVFLFFISKTNVAILKPIFNYLVVALVFAALLFCIQLYNLQENLYYFYKTLNTFTIVALIISIAGYAYIIDWVTKNKSRSISLVLAVLLPFSVLLFVPSDNTNAGYIEGQRFVNYSVDASIYNELAQNATQANYAQRNYTIYYMTGPEQQNDISSMLVKSNKPQSPCYMNLRMAMKETPIAQFDAQTIQQYQADCIKESTTITYAVTKDYVASMQQKIDDALLGNFIHIQAL